MARSGLAELLWAVEIVSEKDEATYGRVLQRHGIDPATFVMVGNSVRSDVLPVLALGGRAVHVPYHVTWELEQPEEDPEAHDFPVLAAFADVPACVAAMDEAERTVTDTIVMLCTGNAARSVMAGAALSALLPDWPVLTAGTLVVEGQPMSWRTRAALESVGLVIPDHRSRQATAADLGHAGLVIALAPEHVHWVRRTHPAVGRPHRHAAPPGPRPARAAPRRWPSACAASGWPTSSSSRGKR